MKDRKVLYADLALLFVAIIWGGGFVATKNILDVLTPFYTSGIRFLIAGVIVGIFSFKKLKKISKHELKAGLIVGFFMFLGFSFQTVGILYTSAGVSAFITAANVVMVPFMYWGLSKKRPNRFEIMGAVFCFLGIAIISFEWGIGIGIGELLTFICAIGFALQIVAVGHFAKEVDPFILSTIQFLFTSLLSFIIAFIFEPPLPQFTSTMIGPLLYMSLVSSMLAFTIQNVAQKYTTTTHAAIFLSLEAVFGSLFGILLLGEQATSRFIVGSIIILLSVITSETRLEFVIKKENPS